jgi:hypothetical protein
MTTLREGGWAEPPTDPPKFRSFQCYLCKEETRSDEYEPGVWNVWLDAHRECERLEMEEARGNVL